MTTPINLFIGLLRHYKIVHLTNILTNFDQKFLTCRFLLPRGRIFLLSMSFLSMEKAHLAHPNPLPTLPPKKLVPHPRAMLDGNYWLVQLRLEVVIISTHFINSFLYPLPDFYALFDFLLRWVVFIHLLYSI